MMLGRNFILKFEGGEGGSGKDGDRIPHDDELENIAFKKIKHLLCVLEGIPYKNLKELATVSLLNHIYTKQNRSQFSVQHCKKVYAAI